MRAKSIPMGSITIRIWDVHLMADTVAVDAAVADTAIDTVTDTAADMVAILAVNTRPHGDDKFLLAKKLNKGLFHPIAPFCHLSFTNINQI
jgi:hypothetical protein